MNPAGEMSAGEEAWYEQWLAEGAPGTFEEFIEDARDAHREQQEEWRNA